MANTELKEKRFRLEDKESGRRHIVVSHITVRQSISLLLFRLVTLELIAAVFVVVLHVLFLNSSIGQIGFIDSFLNIFLIILLIAGKTIFLLFIILQWLNEYYEITTSEVIHRKGFLTKKEQRHRLDHIGRLSIEQSVFGKIFNFGTVRLYNWTTEKEVLLYLIHNPMKYLHILEELLPEADQAKSVFREHLLEPDDAE